MEIFDFTEAIFWQFSENAKDFFHSCGVG